MRPRPDHARFDRRAARSLLLLTVAALVVGCEPEAPPARPAPQAPAPPAAVEAGACEADDGVTLTGHVAPGAPQRPPGLFTPERRDAPCGADVARCGQGPLRVALCETPGCEDDATPLADHVTTDATLTGAASSPAPFAFCVREAGAYHLRALLDHDADGAPSDLDWTSVPDPAPIPITLDRSPPPLTLRLSRVVHAPPSPPWRAGEGQALVVSTLDARPGSGAMGARRLDLAALAAGPRGAASDPLALPALEVGATRHEGGLVPLDWSGEIALLGATDRPGVIHRARLAEDGALTALAPLDLRRSGVGLGRDLPLAGAVTDDGRWLVLIQREPGGVSRPERPRHPLLLVALDPDAEDADAPPRVQTPARGDGPLAEALAGVRFDAVATHGALIAAVESARHSSALHDTRGARLWLFTVDAEGALSAPTVLEVADGRAPGHDALPGCPQRSPLSGAGLWLGRAPDGQTLAVVGGDAGVSVFAVPDELAQARPLGHVALGEAGRGFAMLRADVEGGRLLAIPACPARAGEAEAPARRQAPWLDLGARDAAGLPRLDAAAPPLALDCAAARASLLAAYGASGLDAARVDAACADSALSDAVVTPTLVLITGQGDAAHGRTGLGLLSEVAVFERATGQPRLDPAWSWYEHGLRPADPGGAAGLRLGSSGTLTISSGLLWRP